MENNYLRHHGVKGMKWGVRRYQNPDGTLTPAGKKRYADYDSEAKKMSDQELRSQINRMNLERRYVNASKTGGSKYGRTLDTVGKSATIGNDARKIIDPKDANTKVYGKGLDVVAKTATSAKKIGTLSENKRVEKRAKTKLENMTDKELHDIVNRMELERQYSSLKRETVDRGKTTAMEVLDVAGSVLAAAASATTLAVTIYGLVKK